MDPIEPKHRDLIALARLLNKSFNQSGVKKTGFALLVFDLNRHDGPMNYISNAQRDDMLTAMKEFIASCEGRVQSEGHA